VTVGIDLKSFERNHVLTHLGQKKIKRNKKKEEKEILTHLGQTYRWGSGGAAGLDWVFFIHDIIAAGSSECLGAPRVRLNSRLGNRGPRSFDSKFRNHCTKKLDGALRKSTLYI